jgi:outer membrane protein
MKHSFFVVFLIILSYSGARAQQELSLNEVLQLGLQKNYDIRIIQRTSALAANDNRWAFGGFLPVVNVNGTYLKTTNDTRNLTFPDSNNPEGVETIGSGAKITTSQGQAQLVWTLFDGTRMFATRKRIQELALLGEVNVRNQMMNSAAQIIVNYYNIVRQKQQLKAIQELMGVSEERVKLAERKLQVGTGGKPELLQAKVDLNAQRTAVLLQETLIQQLKDQLSGLLGMDLPEVYEVTDTIPIDLTLTKESILQDIQNTNQAVVAARENIRVAELVLRENRATRSPIINFISNYNYNQSENAFKATPATQLYTRTQGYNYGLQVVIPIINNMNVNRLIGAAKITLDRSKLIYDQQIMIAVVGVRNAFVNYDNAKKSLMLQEENILAAKENVYIALEGFKRGITTALDLRTAQQSLADAYNQLIVARYNAKISETELLRLKGALLR